MCGIAGLISKSVLSNDEVRRFSDSSNLMYHRGPDYKGEKKIDELFFIHFRLSIIDLDARSHQPFISKSERYVVVFNGEIYNFKSLKQEYDLKVRTSSDTEVLLESFAIDGLNAVKKWNGIFACVIYDRQEKKCYFAKDRFGVKPLYIFENDQFIAFASEAKVILDWARSFNLDYAALRQFIWFGNFTNSNTLVKSVEQLEPAGYRVFDVKKKYWIDKTNYWSLKSIDQIKITTGQAVERTKTLLANAVERQLVSDVPIGVLLSGGVDSSGLLAYASASYGERLDTYSVEYDYNVGGKSELDKARLMAKRYNSNHHELKVETKDVVDVFSKLVFQYDFPFADPASIPLYQLAVECSSDKKVILQGDGGDELFAGYRRYNVMDNFSFWYLASKLHFLHPKARWRERLKRVQFVLGQKERGKLLAYYLTEEVPYKSPMSVLSHSLQNKIDSDIWSKDYELGAEAYSKLDRVQQLLYIDGEILLPYRYFEKVDKATMFCSIESRVPYLDNDLAEFAFSLPSSVKVQKGEKKIILKKALEDKVPKDILYGPKRGFDVPFREWLRRDLYDFAYDSFKSADSQILNTTHLLKVLENHKSRKADYSTLLWKSLVLSHWLKTYDSKLVI